MTDIPQKLIDQISDFGVSNAAARIYVLLVIHGPMGIMDLVRHSGQGRNVVYKIVDKLVAAQLVSVAEKSFGKQYTAVQGTAFDAIVARKESQARQLRVSIDEIAHGLLALSGETHSTSKIIHFEGRDGLMQVNWNLTNAKKEFRVYEQSHMDEYMNERFARKVRDQFMAKGIASYELTNRKKIPPLLGMEETDHWKKNVHYRYVEPKVLKIQFEMYIYDNVVTLLDYNGEMPHCIEIHNDRLAHMQRQIFDIVWKQAKEMKLKNGVRKVL